MRPLKYLAVVLACITLASCCARMAHKPPVWQLPHLYGTCPNPPLFDMGGPDCLGQVEQETECRCSECMLWDPGAGGTAPTEYRIYRQTVSTGFTALVGSTKDQNANYTDPESGAIISVTIPAARLWCFARDATVPLEGMLYLYSVMACDGNVCSELSGPTRYMAAPYACYSGGREVACYSGDPIAAP